MFSRILTKIKNMDNDLPIIVGIVLLVYFKIILIAKTVSPDAYLILPQLDGINTFSDYITQLTQLKTYDIQPIRDLSLLIDLYIFKNFSLNTFVFTNVMLWIFGIYTLKNIIELELQKKVNVVFILLYASYPLFAHIVSFTMARKHLLAFFFTLLATFSLLKYLKEKKSILLVKTQLFYFLGVFSQPICLLFPVWVLLYLKIEKKEKITSYLSLILPLVFIFILGFSFNYIYYSKSQVFNFIFTSKTKDLFTLMPKLIALAEYFFSLFFPYNIVFYKEITVDHVVLGGWFFFLFTLAYLLIRKRSRSYVVWMSFSLFPLSIILSTPKVIFDVYLLLPSVGFFILLVDLLPQNLEKKLVPLCLPLLIFFMWFSHLETKTWTNSFLWGETQFNRAPTCNGTVRYARELLSEGVVPEKHILNYIFNNNCFYAETRYNHLEMIVFESQLLFYDETTPLKKKENILAKHGQVNFFPLATLAAIYVKEGNFEKAIKTLTYTTDFLKNAKLDTTYDAIFDKVLLPYCLRINHEGCIYFASAMAVRKDVPYL